MKKILIVVVIIIIGIQFIPVDKTNPNADMSKDFIELTSPPAGLAKVIKSSCYDCHSNHTKYPWYSDIAPFSWLIKEHINNGRAHLNFSIWTDYKERKKDHKVEECIEMIKTGEMPMKAYVMFHSEAEINQEQKMQMITWLTSLRDSLRKSN